MFQSQVGVQISLLGKLEVNGLLESETEEGTIEVMHEDIKQVLFPARNQVFK